MPNTPNEYTHCTHTVPKCNSVSKNAFIHILVPHMYTQTNTSTHDNSQREQQ
jgi:hypothetical protein